MSANLIRWIAVPALTIGMALCTTGCAQVVPKDTSAAETTTSQGQATSAVEQAEEAARMAVEMEKDPARASEILEAHHMTAASYEDLLFKIARDPDLSEAYDAVRTS